jgi:CRISPR-associated protein Cas2
MIDEHLYLVTYDIADDRRWRGVFRLMHGYGEWLQLSVFQCRLTRSRQAELIGRLTSAISATDDHVLIVDLGVAEQVQPRVQSLGKRRFEAIERAPVIV